MAKAKPLKERRKIWATRISRLNRKIIKIHHDFRDFCHHPKCRHPNGCPQSTYQHSRCNERLGVHTALLWVTKDILHENVITELNNARQYLKGGHLSFAYRGIKNAKAGLERFRSTLRLFSHAGAYHSDHELWRDWNKVIIRAHDSFVISNVIYDLERLLRTIKTAVKGTIFEDSRYIKD